MAGMNKVNTTFDCFSTVHRYWEWDVKTLMATQLTIWLLLIGFALTSYLLIYRDFNFNNG